MSNDKLGLASVMLLTNIFIILKLCNIITWSWWWIFAPLWIPFTIFAIIVIGGLVLFIITDVIVAHNKR